MTQRIPGAGFFDGKRVAVVGLGVSGRASVSALQRYTRAHVSAWDSRPEALESLDVETYSHPDGEQLGREILAWGPDVVVIAPGIPETGPLWTGLREAGVALWSEIELAWHLRAVNDSGTAAPWLCITGTNGKTTTVQMLESILTAAGLRARAVGNVGLPAVEAVTDPDVDAFAVELSSFQLAATHSMQATAAVVLNVSDDHLEWHGDAERYAQAKARIYTGATEACFFPVGDRQIQQMVDDADVVEGARAIALSLGVPSVGELGFVDDVAVDRAFIAQRHTQAAELFILDDLMHLVPAGAHLPKHLAQDALAAAGLARAIGVEPRHVREGLRSFTPGRHRIELVEVIDGVTWINDSKATNAHAAQASVLALPDSSAVWIVGGLAKGARFDELVTRVASRLRAVVVLGIDQEPWTTALSQLEVPVAYVDPDSEFPMREAVALARGFAGPADTVILAPACASFDQFGSYTHRGEAFESAVRELL